MRQSNSYIVIFTVVLTVAVGGILAAASILLGPAQQKSIELDTKSQILGAVKNLVQVDEANVLKTYDERIRSLVVNYAGEEVTKDEKGNPLVAEKVDILKNYRKTPEERLYPVFKLVSKENPEKAEAYIIPVYGNGLWDRIWGYVALDSKMKTIVGTAFGHKAETPGLGQRIATQEIQDRYIGKAIFDENANLISVEMTKGEHGGGQSSVDYYQNDPHKVDGMSGATLTGKGLNAMLESYLKGYLNYFKRVQSNGGDVAQAQ